MKKYRKAIVYVDGENFLHRVEDCLKAVQKIRSKLDITHFELRNLLTSLLSDFGELEIRYYGTKIKIGDITDKQTRLHAEAMVESQRRFKRALVNQQVGFVIAGNLRVRETNCRNCRKTTLVFKEKGVDVRLAVDMLVESHKGVAQIVVSSDSDLLPAIRSAKQKGGYLCYLHHSATPNYAMIKSVDESRVFTNSQLIEAYKKANKR
jgi:uncharacterized LabA/DUF88 family protein